MPGLMGEQVGIIFEYESPSNFSYSTTPLLVTVRPSIEASGPFGFTLLGIESTGNYTVDLSDDGMRFTINGVGVPGLYTAYIYSISDQSISSLIGLHELESTGLDERILQRAQFDNSVDGGWVSATFQVVGSETPPLDQLGMEVSTTIAFDFEDSPVGQPVLVTNNPLKTTEGVSRPISGGNILITDSNTANDKLDLLIQSVPANGTLWLDKNGDAAFTANEQLSTGSKLSVYELNSGSLWYMHDGSETTSDSFLFGYSDGTKTVNSNVFRIEITAVNDPPEIILTAPNLQTDEDTPVTLTGLSFSDPDSGANSIAVSLECSVGTFAAQSDKVAIALSPNGRTMMFVGQVSEISKLFEQGGVTYLPPPNFDQQVRIGIYALDRGFTGQGIPRPDMDSMTINITPVDDRGLAQDDAFSLDRNQILTGKNLFEDNGFGIDADVDSPLNITLVMGQGFRFAQPITLRSGATLIVNEDGTFRYDPNGAFNFLTTGQSATDRFTYSINSESTAEVLLTINGVNMPATARDDAFSINRNVVLTDGNLFADNGQGADSDIDSRLSLTQINGASVDFGKPVTLPSGAVLIVNQDGTFRYDPNGAFNHLKFGQSARDRFTYQVNGESTATVVMSIDGIDEPAVARNDAFKLNENASLSGQSVFDDNGSGADRDADSPLTITAVDGKAIAFGQSFTLASGATLVVNANGTFRYDPNGAFDALWLGRQATDAFTYTVSGGSTAVVTITIDGVDGDDLIFGTASADTLFGGLGNDTLKGMGGADRLYGGVGDDSLFGGADAELLVGGDGSDWLDYGTSKQGVQVDLARNEISGGFAAGDSISGFEDVAGGSGNDRLSGNGQSNVFRGNAGADTLNGSSGDDWASYASASRADGKSGGVFIKLMAQRGKGLDAQGDRLFSIENLEGSGLNDQLIGGFGQNTMRGLSGADTLDGRLGIDTLDYKGSTAGVQIHLGTGKANGGHATGDQFSGFENTIGSSFNDTLAGSSGKNVLYGGAGDDVLDGKAGDDVLYAGIGADQIRFSSGNDIAYGGAGEDIVIFDGKRAEYHVSGTKSGDYLIRELGTGATIKLIDMEKAQFSDLTVDLLAG